MPRRVLRLTILAALTVFLAAACGWFAGDGSLVITVPSLPDGVTLITVTVTGDDMEPVTATFTGNPAEDEPLIVPAGSNRLWTVVVDVDNATLATQYTASGRADIIAGEITEVTASLVVSGTKLVIMDDVNQRIVQIDDISGAGWAEFRTSSTLWGMIDLEIGPDLKIYVTDREMTSIHVLDAIPDSSPTVVPGLGELRPEHLGIDHVNGLVYFSDFISLYSVPLAGGAPANHSSLLAAYLSVDDRGIKGLTVDDEGIVYVLYSTSAGILSVVALDPAGGTASPSSDVFNDFESGYSPGREEADIVAKGDRLFVVLYGDSATGPVVELTRDLVVQGSYGELYAGEGAGANTLYGPARFVGHRNPHIQFIDDNQAYLSGRDQIVQMNDILGAGRTNYGDTGFGQGEFEFFRSVPPQ